MTSSRAAANAKILRQHQKRQSATEAKANTNKFTQKQSHFERRQEEDQIKQLQRGGGVVDSTSLPAGSFTNDAPSPFSMHAPRGAKAMTSPASTRSAVLGMGAKVTRATRRTEKFNLTDRPVALATPGVEGSLLGVRRGRDGDEANHDGDEPPQKKNRAERFREMLSASKEQRGQLQRERAARDQETVALDAEITALMHLLPRRNKEEEEREAFARLGRPEVLELLKAHKEQHGAKQLVIKTSGEYSVLPLSPSGAAPIAVASTTAAIEEEQATTASPNEGKLDAADLRLLKQIRSGTAHVSSEEKQLKPFLDAEGHSRSVTATGPSPRSAVPEETDDFDSMLNMMRLDTRRAHAVDRLLTEEEEEAANARQERLEEDRQEGPSLQQLESERLQLTRKEWVERGGDDAFDMDGDGHSDDADLPSYASSEAEVEEEAEADGEGEVVADEKTIKVGSATLDRLLTELEALANADVNGGDSEAERLRAEEQRRTHYHSIVVQLHRYAKTHVLEVSNTFRDLLVEAQRSFVYGSHQTLSRPILMYLLTLSKLFPMTDHHHEVSTPFFIFLCSAVMQSRLDSMEKAHQTLAVAGLLLQSLRAGNSRFASEVLTAPLNVLALQLPRSAAEPIRHQGLTVCFPVLERVDAPLLATAATDKPAEASSCTPHLVHLLPSAPPSAKELILCSYRLLEEAAEMYRACPAFPTLVQKPFEALNALLRETTAEDGSLVWQPCAEVLAAHEALHTKLIGHSAAVTSRRTPLAMRSFRPRPIRLFEPLLAEQEENAAKTEIREIKRELREDKKRVMRHLVAEATVQRREREKEQSVSDSQRERRYNQLMGQLQSQQHLMNTVDAVMSKAKSKQRKGVSGAPKASGGDGGGDAE